MKKIYVILVVIVICELVYLCRSYFLSRNKEIAIDWRQAKASIMKSIQQQGGSKAYERFKVEVKDRDIAYQHFAAHLFGQALYQKMGEKGISVCDDNFLFGCYHGLFSDAIVSNGLGVVGKLEEVCTKKRGEVANCVHGMGHGIMEYVGHSKLNKALDTCSETLSKGVLFECYSGVFMEYYFPFFGSYQVPGFTEYEPCTQIAGKYKKDCFFSLPQKWLITTNRNYQYMGKLCDGLEDEEPEKSCFLGIGFYVPLESNNSFQKSTDICSKMPNENGVEKCLLGASWGSLYTAPSLSQALCNVYNNKKATINCGHEFTQFANR